MDRVEVPPSAFGFRSILPKTREQRFSLKDKVSLERNRINQRVGWQARMHKQNAPETSALLTCCSTGAAGYLSNADRFHTDVVGEEFAIRQEKLRKQHSAEDFKRTLAVKRAEDRWTQMEEKARAEDEYYNKLREDGTKAQKNVSNVAYDILTLQYNQDDIGAQQKYMDDMVRYRAALRSNSLVAKGDTRVGYNIISGDSRSPLQYPDPVAKPASLLRGPPSPRVDRRKSLQPHNDF